MTDEQFLALSSDCANVSKVEIPVTFSKSGEKPNGF